MEMLPWVTLSSLPTAFQTAWCRSRGNPEHETIKPQVDVEVDMAVEENEQKSVDNGHTLEAGSLFLRPMYLSICIYHQVGYMVSTLLITRNSR